MTFTADDAQREQPRVKVDWRGRLYRGRALAVAGDPDHCQVAVAGLEPLRLEFFWEAVARSVSEHRPLVF